MPSPSSGVSPWQSLVVLFVLAVTVSFVHLSMVQSEWVSFSQVAVLFKRHCAGVDAGRPECKVLNAVVSPINVLTVQLNHTEVETEDPDPIITTTDEIPAENSGQTSLKSEIEPPKIELEKEDGGMKKWKLKPEEVALMVMTGKNTGTDRIPILDRLFTSFNVKIPVIAISEVPMSHGNWTFVQPDCPASHTAGLCCKTARGYEWIFRNKPEVKWIFRGCDDTYVHLPNLIAYLEHFDPDRPWYLGDHYFASHVTVPYADGGAGWIISRGALAKVVPGLYNFFHELGERCFDDTAFGRFMHTQVNIPLRQASGVHNEEAEIVPCDGGNCGKVALMLHALHDFHPHQNDKRAESRPISFHARIGKQAGDNIHNYGEDAILKLRDAVIEVSAHVPIVVEEDMAAINS